MIKKERLLGTVAALVLSCVALLWIGCSGDDDNAVFRPTANEQFIWEFQNPLPQANRLNAVCSDGSGGLFAVGNAGTVLHYDGLDWETQSVGTQLWFTPYLREQPIERVRLELWARRGFIPF